MLDSPYHNLSPGECLPKENSGFNHRSKLCLNSTTYMSAQLALINVQYLRSTKTVLEYKKSWHTSCASPRRPCHVYMTTCMQACTTPAHQSYQHIYGMLEYTHTLSFLQTGCPSCRPTNSVKAVKANTHTYYYTSGTEQQWSILTRSRLRSSCSLCDISDWAWTTFRIPPVMNTTRSG